MDRAMSLRGTMVDALVSRRDVRSPRVEAANSEAKSSRREMESFVREVGPARSEVEAVNPEADWDGLEVVPIKSDGDPFSLRMEWGGWKGESSESKVVPSNRDVVPVVHKVASD